MKQYQDPVEFEQWLGVLCDHNVRSYLEIGSLYGQAWHDASVALPPGSRTVSLDLPSVTKGSEQHLRDRHASLVGMGYDAKLIIGNSRSGDAFAMACAYGPYDAIFIDGDHSYEGVKADWESYGRLAPIVGFHDIGRVKCDVPMLWRELKAKHRHTEFINRPGCLGIGVIWRSMS